MRRALSTAAAPLADGRRVGVLMLNMGGPSSLDGPEDGVEAFLRRLFLDPEIIRLGPLQSWLVRERCEGGVRWREAGGAGIAR
jgi:Ferrochelatase